MRCAFHELGLFIMVIVKLKMFKFEEIVCFEELCQLIL